MKRELTQIKTIATAIAERLESQCPSTQPVSFDCHICEDAKWLHVEGGATQCECAIRAKRERLLGRIPPEYRRFELATIKPEVRFHDKQSALFTAIKADPTSSLLLSGRNGCGKSLIGWLLYRQAIEQGRPAVALPLADLLIQFRQCELDSEKHPCIDAETLRSDKRRWLIFLDEFEKARPTEFAAERLFGLMDAVYSFRHQLVITSNYDKDELQERWSQTNEAYGRSIMRRVLELDGMIRVEMF